MKSKIIITEEMKDWIRLAILVYSIPLNNSSK